jgi:type IV secretory pathway VirB10-like protein
VRRDCRGRWRVTRSLHNLRHLWAESKSSYPRVHAQPISASIPHSSTIMAEALTKKQQKALAFKNKQKSKRRGDGELEQPDVPEQDLLNDDDEEVPEKVVEKKEKAKKEVTKDVEEGGAEESEKKKGKRKKTAWDDEEEEEEGEKVAKKSKKDIKQRFILFVGELLSAANVT